MAKIPSGVKRGWKIKKIPKKNGAFWKKHGTKWRYSSPAWNVSRFFRFPLSPLSSPSIVWGLESAFTAFRKRCFFEKIISKIFWAFDVLLPKMRHKWKNCSRKLAVAPSSMGLRHQCGETWTSVGSAPPDRLHLEDWDTPVIFSANQLIFEL